MLKLPQDLSKAKILVTNDDGVHAPGIKLLEEIARRLSDNVWVMAPETEQSCKSHSLTLDRPLSIKKIDDRKFYVNGTPSDTMLLAINHIFKDSKPDLVLSGINFGRNAGVDVTYSGTIAAAMEATMLGVPSIALSQVIADNAANWEVPDQHAEGIIRKLLAMAAWPRDVLMNVNFPACAASEVKGARVASHFGGKSSDDIMMRENRWGEPYFWVGHSVYSKYADNTDMTALEQNYISITPLHTDLTHYEMLREMQGSF
ncbi:MAG TPA: 5'/3'-nucleotidase SurE [Alphaproteobacteria bacterium]|nr:5'/3'-nucleotidase SurE [Rhodospirillaceae bacterium]HRJ12238.1 5'/3'-nucleotidase SurE [Alphaproteobacteria bacterium]